MKKKTILILIGLVLIVLVGGTYLYAKTNCMSIQVLVSAKNIFTGEVRTFGNPCAVPLFWKQVNEPVDIGYVDTPSAAAIEEQAPEIDTSSLEAVQSEANKESQHYIVSLSNNLQPGTYIVSPGQENVPAVNFKLTNDTDSRILLEGLSVGSENANNNLKFFSQLRVAKANKLEHKINLTKTESYHATFPIWTTETPLKIEPGETTEFVLYGNIVNEPLTLSFHVRLDINGGVVRVESGEGKATIEGSAYGVVWTGAPPPPQ